MNDMESGSADTPGRRARIAAQVRAVFADVAGFDIGEDEGDVRFVELGMDSLLLTQVALRLRKAFPVPVTFRQLMEDCATVDRLVGMLDDGMPADAAPSLAGTGAPAAPPAQALPAPPAAPVVPAQHAAFAAASDPTAAGPTPAAGPLALDAGTIRALVDLQVHLMTKQLALLAHAHATSAPAKASLHQDGEGT